MRVRRAMLAILLAIHAAIACVPLIVWYLAGWNSRLLLLSPLGTLDGWPACSLLVSSVGESQIGLLACWAVFGGRHYWVRVPAAFAVLLLLWVARTVHWWFDSWISDAPFLAFMTMRFTVILGLLAWANSLMSADCAGPSLTAARPFLLQLPRVSLRHMFAVVTSLCALSAMLAAEPHDWAIEIPYGIGYQWHGMGRSSLIKAIARAFAVLLLYWGFCLNNQQARLGLALAVAYAFLILGDVAVECGLFRFYPHMLRQSVEMSTITFISFTLSFWFVRRSTLGR